MEKIRAVMIFEVLGKPAEHVKEALFDVVDRLGKEKGARVIRKKVQEARKVENSELFTSFSEVEVEVDGMARLMVLMFNYMPAHIEIISPSELKMKNFDFCEVCNELMTKLHAYDGVAKTLIIEKSNLINQLNQLAAKVADASEVSGTKTKTKKTRKKKKI